MPKKAEAKCKAELTKLVQYDSDEIDRRRSLLRGELLLLIGVNLEGLTDKVVDVIINKYDDMIFNGYIKRRLKALKWKMENRSQFTKTELRDEHDSAAFLYYQKRKGRPDEIGLVFNRDSLTKLREGVKCSFRQECTKAFDCFMNVFEHELIHLIQFTAKNCSFIRKSGRHDKVFMGMARKWFGHTTATHSLW